MRTRSQVKVMKEEEMVINTENYCKTDELVDGQKCIILRLDNIHSAKAVTKISQLREQEKTNKVFNKVWASPDLQNFHINKYNLGCVDQDILSSLPPDLRILSLVETGLGEEQVLSLLTGIGRHDNLTSLSLEGEDLTSVDNQTLARAVGKLGKLSIRNCYIDTDQIETILQCVSKLKNLTEVTLAGTEDEPVYLTEDELEEGKFFWMSTGKPVTYENWNAGEPNNFQYENGEQEHCLELWNRDGKGLRWNDTPCSFETFFVCEV